MKRVNGSSCILLYGTFLFIVFFVSSTQISNINATRWHPDWNKSIKLFYNKLLNRQLQSQQQTKSRRSGSTEGFEDRSKKLADLTSPDGMVLGGHSVSSSFRLRKKRGSFRLKRVPTLADVVPLPMKYMPLSYFDTYYALGNARARRLENGLSDDIYLGSPANMLQEEPTMEDEKRASFRLKKIPEDAVDRLEPFEKRASFRLKRILDSYKDLLGPPSSGSYPTSAFRLRKRGGTSSFRLKRGHDEGLNKEYDVRLRH